MRLTIGKRITVGFGFAILLVVLIAFTSYQSTTKFDEMAQRRQHSHEVLRALEALNGALVNAETGQRGYLIAGEDIYLEPYSAALSRLDDVRQQLRALMSSDPKQAARLDRLDAPVREKLAELAETISVRKEKGHDAARQIVMTDRGKRGSWTRRGAFSRRCPSRSWRCSSSGSAT